MMTHGRNVSYDIPDPELPEISQWLISNPNRVNLGRIGLRYQGATLSARARRQTRVAAVANAVGVYQHTPSRCTPLHDMRFGRFTTVF